MALKTKLDVYPLENYIISPTVEDGSQIQAGSSGGNNSSNNIGIIEKKVQKNPIEKLISLKRRCREEECVHSVDAVLLVHLHRHPHIILLKVITEQKIKDATGTRVIQPEQLNNEVAYRLPGGRCRRGETEESCILRKLGRQLLNERKTAQNSDAVGGGDGAAAAEGISNGAGSNSDTIVDVGMPRSGTEAASFFRIGEVLSRWYRPHFTPLMYPYVPPHIATSSVKEVRSVFLVHMEPSAYFTMQQGRGVELVAVPLFDLYENVGEYGPIVASLPAVLSRVLINYCDTDY